MAHTPAPWHVGEDEFHWWVSGADTTKNVICEITPRQIHYYDYAARQEEIPEYQDEDRANAALITAAPELLEACKEVLGAFDNDAHRGDGFYNGENSAIARIKIAIAKAESKESA